MPRKPMSDFPYPMKEQKRARSFKRSEGRRTRNSIRADNQYEKKRRSIEKKYR